MSLIPGQNGQGHKPPETAIPATIASKAVHVALKEDRRSCAIHGDFTAILWGLRPLPTPISGKPYPACLSDFWSQCPTCDAVMQREADERDAAIRGGVSAKEQLTLAKLAAANIPERFKDARIWSWQRPMDRQKTIHRWAAEFCSAFDIVLETGRCGVFSGAPGTGKTLLSVGMLRHVLDKGGTGYYTTVMDMLGRIKDTYNRAAKETEQAVVKVLTSVDLLVIDEVGRALDSNYEQAQFFRILDLRYRHLKPVILVSNLAREALLKFLGDALVDRLQESGGAIHNFDWASQRSHRKKEQEDKP